MTLLAVFSTGGPVPLATTILAALLFLLAFATSAMRR